MVIKDYKGSIYFVFHLFSYANKEYHLSTVCKVEPHKYTEGVLLSFRNVSDRVGLARASMKCYPRVLALLQAHNLVRTEKTGE